MNKNILTTQVGELGTCCYIVYCEENRECAIIDPGGECDRLSKKIDSLGLAPKTILLTHGHCDHIGAVSELMKRYASNGIKLGCHESDMAMITDPALNYSLDFGGKISISADFSVKDGDRVEVGKSVRLRVIHTPGHTKGGCSYYYEEAGVLFSGDTLFAETVGRTDLYGGSMEELITSVRDRLFALDDKTVVLPGHGPHTTIGHEKRYNMCAGPDA